jgi:hypothetical protein
MPRTTNGWTTMSGTQNFNTHYALSSVGNLNVSFTGRDDRFWAGYYGPRIRDINVSMLYSVAPPPVQTDFPSWVKLTDENGNFTLTSSGVVRYGANGTYVYQNFQPGTYSCSNGAWGRDPLGGVYKECDLGSNTSPTPTPTPSVPKIQTVTTTTTDPTSTVTNPTIVTNPTTVSTPTTTLSSSSNSGNNGMTDTSSATSSNLIGSVTASPTIVSAPAPVVSSTSTTSSSSPSQSSSSSSSTGSTTSTTTATVTATVATPSGGPSKESGGGGTSIGLSVVAKNQQREQAIAMQASASAVAAADQAGKTAQQEAVSVAGSAVSNSLVQGQSALKSDSNSGGSKIGGNSVGFIDMTTQNTQTNSSATSGSGNTTTRDSTQLQTNVMNNVFTSSTQSVSVMQSTQSQNYLASSFSVSDTQQTSNSNLSYSLLPPIQPVGLSNGNLATYQIASYTPPEQTSFKIQSVSVQTESYQLKPPSVLTDRTSFINDIIEGKQFIPQSNTTINTGPVVNKDAQDNEAAGGVSINKMALAPKGYGDYLNFTMRDVAFYEPKEVYKNQKTVDNVRAFRSLANDSKHKEMVEQQYRIGK